MGRKLVETYELQKPVEFDDGSRLEKLEFHEITAGDMDDMPMPMTPKSFFHLAAASTGQPIALIREMGPLDALHVIRITEGFFEGGPATGST